MSDVALPGSIEPALKKGPDLDKGFHPLTGIIYMGVVAAALLFVAYNIYSDIDATGTHVATYTPYILLFVALLIALGFEFVNGFHDTANAVATVIYTRSLPANIAVVWSGMFNLFGVLLSSGAVAFGIVSLLPVELILQVGSSAGFAMVFALLIAAIIWNVGTWYLGLPASSLSFHLKELTHANLIVPRQEGRFVIYAARFDTMNALVGFLTENCCGGKPCGPACGA